MRIPGRLAVAVAACIALGACGGDSETAADPSDPGESPTSAPPSTSAGTPSPTPSSSPTADTYPAFGPEDYRYTLVASCFCVDAGTPVRISVEDGEVTDAVYLATGRGIRQGDQAPDIRRLTINDVIDLANASGDAASVSVTWPPGQDYPTSVAIDRSRRVVDEQIGYDLGDVEVR